MATTRTATTTWDGGLAHGTGTTSVGSGTFGPVGVSWARRTEDPEGATSPEELIAAAHASCFAMALSHELGQAGGTDIHLEISAAVSFDPTASPPITGSALTVSGSATGIDAAGFREKAEAAKAGCPVSQALAGVNITLTVQ
jgi:osmotically inducible protein OsmC